ncbi:MAG: sigma-54 dependent transcriptional regulator [Halioglobus sp.]
MEKHDGTILIVDDDLDILTAGKLLLKRHYNKIVTCDDPAQVESLMAQHEFDAIMLDMNFSPGESSGKQGFIWLKRILEIDPMAIVVLITAHGGVDVAVEAMKIGATDFIAKPWQNEKVVATLSAGVKLRRSRNEAQRLKSTNRALAAEVGRSRQPMLGDSAAMQQVVSMIARAAPTDANVLILGEHGTGKELVARAIYQQSRRAGNTFLTVDLGAVSESLFESELFGHVKGAFTDAREDRVGRLQAANGGTLFLDEIGNIPLHLQAKLLSVLEQRQVTPVGANRAIDFDVRVIAATNLPAQELHNETRFRQDLLFRLNTVEIALPPLRKRQEDITTIARHYLELYSRKYSHGDREFSPEAIAALSNHTWPGNVRALRHAVERAVILTNGPLITPADLQLSAATESITPVASYAPTPSNIPDEDLNLSRLEKQTIQQALTGHQYNISRAAKALGLTRAALYRRMEKYEI